ncbi:MAG: hypothetical protein ABIF71_02625 [Planctomycetota bacterium]
MAKNLVMVAAVIGLLVLGTVWALEPQDAVQAQAGQPVVQPVLAVTQWQGTPVSLENLKGQLSVVVFFDDATSCQGPFWAGAAQKIKEYTDNNSIRLLPIGVFKNPSNFKSFACRLWGNDISIGLDAGNTTNKLLGGPINNCAIVILGPEGDTLWRGGNLTNGDSSCNAMLEAIGKHSGTGLVAGITVPDKAVMLPKAIASIKDGNLSNAKDCLKNALKIGNEAATAATLLERIEKLCTWKKAQFDALVTTEGKAWDAYKVGESYLACFSKAEDAKSVNETLNQMRKQAIVANNLVALKMLQTAMKKSSGAVTKIKKDLDAIARQFPDTECAALIGRMTDCTVDGSPGQPHKTGGCIMRKKH